MTSPAPRDPKLLVSLIAEVTGVDDQTARRRLEEEIREPGSTVARAFAQAGAPRWQWSEALERFYNQTDAFVYELAAWHRNRLRRRMGRWVRRRIEREAAGAGLDILCLGDGLGFDALDLHRAGHRVTYFEVPGHTERFARRLFEHCQADIHVLTDPAEIPENAYDAIVCLDVLEHVPDAPAFVRTCHRQLREAGLLFAHAPFYMIHPAYPTHLKANRRFSGSLALYTRAGFRLADGQLGWNPLMLRKGRLTPDDRTPHARLRRALVRLAQPVLCLGRLTALPFHPVHWARRRIQKEGT